MPDLTFIARVAAQLLTTPGAAHRSWAGRHRLQAVARTRLGDDPATAAMIGAGDLPRPDLTGRLAAAMLSGAETDPAFAAALRQLLVEAYAEPGMADGLPDPAPLLD